jgi:hypothetical protein
MSDNADRIAARVTKVNAVLDQMHAALRDRDDQALRDAAERLFTLDPAAAQELLRQSETLDFDQDHDNQA